MPSSQRGSMLYEYNFVPTAPTGAPANLMITGTTTTSLSLSWGSPPTDQQNGAIRHYMVLIMDVTNQTSWDIRVNGTTTTITGLNPFFTYNCSVAAITVATGPASFSVVITLPQSGRKLQLLLTCTQ